MNKTINNIDYQYTLSVAIEENMSHIMTMPDSHQIKLHSEGKVLESSLIVGKDTDTVVKITKQIPLGFYIDKKGKYIESKTPMVDPFKIIVYYPCDGIKTVYKVVEVQKDVPYDVKELEFDRVVVDEK